MKVNILDAGLRRKPGHHFDYDRKLAQQLVAAGHDVHVYGYAKMEDEAASALAIHAPVTKLLRPFFYDEPGSLDFYDGELPLYRLQSQALAEDLQAVRAADLWIWPSVRAQHLNACVLAKTAVPIVACVHEDPGVAERSLAARLWRATLVRAHDDKLPYTLGALEPELRHRFMPIMPDARFALFPHPYDGPPISAAKTALKRIGFFGQQRQQKGTGLMASLFAHLLKDGYEIVLQDSLGNSKLAPGPQITMLGYVEDMTEHLAACDLVVLPYEVAGYRNKGSGMLAACLSLGIPVIGPVDTIPGRTIEQFGVGPLFPWTRPDAIYAAIKLTDQNYARYAANALSVARTFAKRNGIARYAKALLAAGVR